MPLEFGIFDHQERRRDVPLDRMYEERLELVARADQLGFWGYHVAEHHQAPLCMSPSPNVFLAAAARVTRDIRLGALVYQLPFHHPLRLIEEVCMLDNLSGGRLQLGVGRGITAIEHTWWGTSPAEAHARYEETLSILVAGLSGDTLSHRGRFYRFDDLPLEMEPLQRPYPPLWHAGNPDIAGVRGTNYVGRGGARLAASVARYRELWAEHRGRPDRLNPHVAEPVVGGSHHVLVAETDAEAERLARAAWPAFHANFAKRGQDGPGPETRPDGSVVPAPPGGVGTPEARDFDRARRHGSLVVGGPDTVRELVCRFAEESGADYFVGAFHWGAMTHAQALHSLELFATEVMARPTPAVDRPDSS